VLFALAIFNVICNKFNLKIVTEQINLEEIKIKLVERLKPSGWADKLRGFIQSSDFDKILDVLYKLREDGKRFTPPLKNVFRAFEECPVNNLRVIMIGQDPYPQFGVADGLAFSCSNTERPQPSLRNMFEAIDATVYDNERREYDPNLTRWAEQGVLLLNSALTCEIDKIGSHYNIWKDFIAYVMDILNFTDSGLIFVLLGKQAQELEGLIGEHHHIIKVSHPASAAYTKTTWDCSNMFNEINRIINGQNGPSFKINW
jgi:uracil-DNA glycosylase